MRFPNLLYAASQRGLLQFQLASAAGLSESRLSRCLRGRHEFSDVERERIAKILDFDSEWLFSRPELPRAKNSIPEDAAIAV